MIVPMRGGRLGEDMAARERLGQGKVAASMQVRPVVKRGAWRPWHPATHVPMVSANGSLRSIYTT